MSDNEEDNNDLSKFDLGHHAGFYSEEQLQTEYYPTFLDIPSEEYPFAMYPLFEALAALPIPGQPDESLVTQDPLIEAHSGEVPAADDAAGEDGSGLYEGLDSEDNDEEDDEQSDVLEEEELIDIADDGVEEYTSTPTHHLPITVYTNYHSSLLSMAFIGLYGADGINSATKNTTGFYFRSTEFVWLYKFLINCGVQNPRLYFYNRKSVNITFKAGCLGGVSWCIYNAPLKKAREALGLPSSRIKSTDISKAEAFLNGLSLNELIVMILYWIAGDGHVGYKYINRGTALSLSRLCIASKDRAILELMQQTLQNFGFLKTNIKKHNSNEVYYLYFLKDPELYQVIVEALGLIPAECIHAKLLFLKQVLESGGEGIPLSQGPPRTFSFFRYLGEHRQDKMACVLAQDLYVLSLKEVNEILEFAGFEILTDTRDLDLGSLVNHALNLKNKKDPTKEERLFLDYFSCCEKRIPANCQPIDFIYKMQPSYKCFICDIVFYQRRKYTEHIKYVHQNVPKETFTCALCGKVYKQKISLQEHINLDHLNIGKTIECPNSDCQAIFGRKSLMQGHFRSQHLPGSEKFQCLRKKCNAAFDTKFERSQHFETAHQPFHCLRSYCTKRFTSPRHRKEHMEAAHGEGVRKRFECPVQGCGKSYTQKGDVKKHMQTKHPDA